MIHVYAASNATWLSQRVLRLSRQRAASAHVIIEIGKSKRGKLFATQKSFDGASEASGVFYQQRNEFRRSKRSERSFISNKKPAATERAKRAEFFICNKHYFFIIEI